VAPERSFVPARVRPTPIRDQSSLYRGRHFTLLIALRDEGSAAGGLSHAVLKARIKGEETRLATAPNTLVLFEGARISHKVTPILAGERRLMLSMIYCTDERAHW